MSTLTKEWLKHTIAELEEERDATPGAVNEDAAMALAAMKLALASLESEPVGEVVLGEYDDCGCHPDARVACIAADGHADWESFKDGTRLFTAPPASVVNAEPVSFDALRDAVAEVSGAPEMEWSDIYKGHQAVPFINFNSLARIVDKFRTAPPAPVSLPDEVNVLLNHLEDVLPDDAFNLIDVKTWNNVSMLSRPDVYRTAMLQGAEPVTTAYKLPDGYVLVPVEPTAEMMAEAKRWTGLTSTAEIVYREMIAAAPLQEV